MESAAFRLPTLAKTGYIFNGWYRKGSDTRVTSINKGSTGSVELYAKWTPIKYNIVYSANRGQGRMTTSSGISYDKSFTLSANQFTRKGYRFAGWNTKADGTGTSYQDKQSVKNLLSRAGNVTLYAKWSVITYTLSLNPNGGAPSGSQKYDSRLKKGSDGTYACS